MITEAVVFAFMAVVRGILTLIPSGAPPAFVSDGLGMLEELMEFGAGLGAWVPFSVAGYVIAAVISCITVGFTVKLIRIVASFFTAGGGSAA